MDELNELRERERERETNQRIELKKFFEHFNEDDYLKVNG